MSPDPSARTERPAPAGGAGRAGAGSAGESGAIVGGGGTMRRTTIGFGAACGLTAGGETAIAGTAMRTGTAGRIAGAGRGGAGLASTTTGGAGGGGATPTGGETTGFGAARKWGSAAAPPTAQASKSNATPRLMALMIPTPLADNITRKW